MVKDLVAAVSGAGRISADDVLAFRRAYYSDSKITPDEAGAIFAANEACTDSDPTWPVFFCEALCDFVVHQMEPSGFVSDENASWLMSHIDHDGTVRSQTELELLVAILEQARSVPESLCTYALDCVRQAVLTGDGPLRNGKELQPGVVDEADVDLLRRILYAYAGGGNIAITAAEAEILFAINDATEHAEENAAWNDLFAKAIANHLMFASFHTPLTREVALRQEEWARNTSVSPATFVTSMVVALRDVYSWSGAKPAAERNVDADIAAAEQVTAAEAAWLAERIGRSGAVSPAEKAALQFIKQEAPNLPPVLQELLDKVA